VLASKPVLCMLMMFSILSIIYSDMGLYPQNELYYIETSLAHTAFIPKNFWIHLSHELAILIRSIKYGINNDKTYFIIQTNRETNLMSLIMPQLGNIVLQQTIFNNKLIKFNIFILLVV
jgi:hypothetical protein